MQHKPNIQRFLRATSVILGLVAIGSGIWAMSGTDRAVGIVGELAGGLAMSSAVALVALDRVRPSPEAGASE